MKSNKQNELFENAARAVGANLAGKTATPAARENGRKWFEHYTRNKNRAKILEIAEGLFIAKVGSLPGDVFYDNDSCSRIALQCLNLGEIFVTELSEKLWIQDAAVDPDK